MKILDVPRSGSIAGTTSSHNRAGQYVRNRRTPTNAPTARRTAIRSAMGAASSAWSSLTPTEQASWAAAAASHPITDALGQSITLTGHQFFVGVQTQFTNSGNSGAAALPADFSVFSVSGSTATFGVAAGLAGVLPAAGSADDFILVGLSKPLPGGRTFWKTFTQDHVLAGNAAALTMTTAAYAAKYGTPSAGQNVFLKFTPVNQYGVTGVAQVIKIRVTA
jgi:hypothetical protein